MNDMFKKFFKPSTNTNKQDEAQPVNLVEEAEEEEPAYATSKIWLKYKEGFINAVRYPIKIRQLL